MEFDWQYVWVWRTRVSTGIRLGTDWFLANLFFVLVRGRIHSENIKKGKKVLAEKINFTLSYIDVLSINSAKYDKYLHIIYPSELEIRDHPTVVRIWRLCFTAQRPTICKNLIIVINIMIFFYVEHNYLHQTIGTTCNISNLFAVICQRLDI